MTSPALPRLVLLGTGAAANPSRCHASIAVQIGTEHTLLLDTGSGIETVRHLRRASVDLASIADIFLSHRHSDHIGGLELVLLHCALQGQRTGRHAPRLTLHGSPLVLDVARTLLDAMGSVAPMLLRGLGQALTWHPVGPCEAVDIRPGVRLTPFVVDHQLPDGTCLGCVIELRRDRRVCRIVYSADTRPNDKWWRYAQGADVLLHECGGLDARADQVHAVGHCTAGDAGRLATTAGAGHLVLVHIPEEASVGAIAGEAQRYFSGQVTVANDLQEIPLTFH